MEKNYDPQAIEPRWYEDWLRRGCFHGETGRPGEPYCVVIPPPNVTGILHMGHALNNTIQDILVRWRRMQGRNTVWMPGTDHAGIATQNVVERSLKAEGTTRHDLGREAFLERVWKWREEYGGTIIRQLKRLGASCDWERERFTMDEGLSRAVTEVFVRLYEEGLVYRASYIINWCPRCHTALSDEESEHADTAGKLYYIRYPVVGEGPGPRHIVVATTRPETLLGDTAVAVHPDDERYRALHGRLLRLPALGREIPVIVDPAVDPKFGTGAVKVTPAHDPNDFEMGRRHGLEQIDVMNGDATMNAVAGPYAGMDRFACRAKLLEDLEAAGLLEKIEEHRHAVGHCYRCDTVVEPRVSPQWFVRMQPLAGPAIEAVTSGRVRFVPERWTKVYLEWMTNIRDWCISRQIWWGHRIPVYYCDACPHEWAARTPPTQCPRCGRPEIRQDEDVLDTWFSSWLWPFSTFGWPETTPDLKTFYPTHDLVTASEIIFFWVARMIMAGLHFMGDVPFRTVYIHGTVRDDRGRKMSKSLGNSIDPLNIISKYSADALRFSLTMLTATGQDVYISDEKFELGRNFGTKIWNAARFMVMHAGQPGAGGTLRTAMDPARLTADDRYILYRLQAAIRDCTANLEKFRFNDAAHALYDLVWHQYCDWYLEYAKELLYGDDREQKEQLMHVMNYVFSTILRLLHPFMPFITEELWHAMGYGTAEERILHAPWPAALTDEELRNLGVTAADVEFVEGKHALVRAARNLKADYGIPAGTPVDYFLRPNDAVVADRLAADAASVRALARAKTLTVRADFAPDRPMPSALCPMGTLYMPLEGLIDVDAEIKRQNDAIAKLGRELKGVTAKLENPDFVQRAPDNVVAQVRAKREKLLEESERLRKLVETMAALRSPTA